MIRASILRAAAALIVGRTHEAVARFLAASVVVACCFSCRPAQAEQMIASFMGGDTKATFGEATGLFASFNRLFGGHLDIHCSSKTDELVVSIADHTPFVGHGESHSIEVLVDGKISIPSTAIARRFRLRKRPRRAP